MYCIAHEYKQDGVLKSSGAEFKIDREAQTITLVSLNSSKMGVYETYSSANPASEDMYGEYMLNWLDDIDKQGFVECSGEIWHNALDKTDSISESEQEKNPTYSR